ncbi:hypothetical protein Tcan_11097 [Toxocara canis]|uniref:Uncharacterized protein n=1 Tax=Toxocara canis TaxID=6265 RepID=A0A0B2VVA5_TOXCA|nr:hypothetical protein Tcan_11097 [Toxocara canis]
MSMPVSMDAVSATEASHSNAQSTKQSDASKGGSTQQKGTSKRGVRDISLNFELIDRLDETLSRVESVQRTLHCCGLKSSREWLEEFTGNFTVVMPSRYNVWWMNNSQPSRFPLSCCSGDMHCATNISVWNNNNDAFSPMEIVGCGVTAIRQVTIRLKLMSGLLVGVTVYHFLLAVFNYFLIEKKRRIARCLHMRYWQNQLQVTLQQQKRKAMLAASNVKRNCLEQWIK